MTRRYLAIPAEAYAVATGYLASAFDQLNFFNDDAIAEFDEQPDAANPPISLEL